MGAKPKNPCAFCGHKATRLCDYQVSQRDREVITCDTPLCGQCAISEPLVSMAESIDWCPNHQEPLGEPFIPYPVPPVYVADTLQKQETAVAKWREDHAAAINQYNITEATNGR